MCNSSVNTYYDIALTSVLTQSRTSILFAGFRQLSFSFEKIWDETKISLHTLDWGTSVG